MQSNTAVSRQHYLMAAGNSTLQTAKEKMTTRNHGDERQILLFILREKKVFTVAES